LALAASAVLVVSIVIQSGGRQAVHADFAAKKTESVARAVPAAANDASNAQDVAAIPAAAARDGQPELMVQAPQSPAAAPVFVVPLTLSPAPAIEQEKEAQIGQVTVQAARRAENPQQAPIAVSALVADAAVQPPQRDTSAADDKPAASTQEAVASALSGVRPRESGALEEISVTAMFRGNRSAQGAGPRGTIPMQPGAASDAKAEREWLQAQPERWLTHIRELRAAGKRRDADREWRDFMKRYPDYPVAQTDAARAAP
jgi:hypothetical protein